MSFQENPKFTKMIPNGYLIFEDESFLDSTVAKMNALRKSGQFCDVRLQVRLRICSAAFRLVDTLAHSHPAIKTHTTMCFNELP